MTGPDAPARAALDRLLAIAQHGTGQSRRVAGFLLTWWDARDCGGFDLTGLWTKQPKVPRPLGRGMVAEGIEDAIAADMLAVMNLIAHHRGYPTAHGLGPDFERLVEPWRPTHVLAVR